MKIALLCPSNILYMPYIRNYEGILKQNKVDYTIINWDRFQIEDNKSEFIYKDNKIGHKRNYYDYYKYKNFLVRKLDKYQYDKVIVFSLQLAYFLRKYLVKKYEHKFIIDIRDYNRIIKFFRVKKVLDSSFLTVISSPGYKMWLPDSSSFSISHNTTVDNIDQLIKSDFSFLNKKINIPYIGALTNLNVNVDFINTLKNNNKFNLTFHGEGMINQNLKDYKEKYNINNLHIYGRYEKREEVELYKTAHMINMLLYNNHINNRTCLANRLYNSAQYGKPMIALEGSYLANEIKNHNLGLVIDSFADLENKILGYLSGFDEENYNKGRESFFRKVINDNSLFKSEFNKFLEI